MCVCVCVCVCIGVSAYPQKHHALSLFCQDPHKSENCQSPLSLPIPFIQFVPQYFGFLQSSLKSSFFSEP